MPSAIPQSLGAKYVVRRLADPVLLHHVLGHDLDDLDGAMNAEIFRYYVRHVLTPTLTPGDVVVMDNLPAHKGRTIRDLI